MSKKIKQLEMESLTKTFQGLRDLVVLTASGVDCIADHQFRTALRKKNVRLQMVKNSLARKVFSAIDLQVDGIWEGSTLLAWGTDSLSELSKAIDELLKKQEKGKEKIRVKKAVSEGQAVPFEQALKMPSRSEAIGQVLALLLSPGARLAGQLRAPGGLVAGQIKTISEKKVDSGTTQGQPTEAPPAE